MTNQMTDKMPAWVAALILIAFAASIVGVSILCGGLDDMLDAYTRAMMSLPTTPLF